MVSVAVAAPPFDVDPLEEKVSGSGEMGLNWKKSLPMSTCKPPKAFCTPAARSHALLSWAK